MTYDTLAGRAGQDMTQDAAYRGPPNRDAPVSTTSPLRVEISTLITSLRGLNDVAGMVEQIEAALGRVDPTAKSEVVDQPPQLLGDYPLPSDLREVVSMITRRLTYDVAAIHSRLARIAEGL